VLLHPTALPGTTGIGTIRESGRRFVDLLADCGFSLWQTCPLGPTGFGDSPYQCLSAFAGNPYLVDPDELVRLGLLYEDEVEPSRTADGSAVDYGALWHLRPRLLHLAAEEWRTHPGSAVFQGRAEATVGDIVNANKSLRKSIQKLIREGVVA